MRELTNVIREAYPTRPDLIKAAVGYPMVAYWSFAQKIRNLPLVEQEPFFVGVLKETLALTEAQETSPRIGEPDIKNAAALMTRINIIPLQTESQTPKILTGYAEQHLNSLGISHPPKIALVEYVGEIAESLDRIDGQIHMYANHPLTSNWDYIRVPGFVNFANLVVDPPWGNMASGLTPDILLAAGFEEGYYDNKGRDLAMAFANRNWSFDTHMSEHRLSRAIAWEAMLPLVQKTHPEIKGNPYRIYVDAFRPTQWPIGWDNSRQEFLIGSL
jgi:hypothetical protein